jgi:hypothetical protein
MVGDLRMWLYRGHPAATHDLAQAPTTLPQRPDVKTQAAPSCLDVESGLIALEASVGGTEWLRGARRARRLATLSLAWLCLEGAATTTAGLLAGSIALVGNGLAPRSRAWPA